MELGRIEAESDALSVEVLMSLEAELSEVLKELLSLVIVMVELVARELSVLVIEAGGDKSKDPFVTTPGLMGALYGKDEYDWNFLSVPQVCQLSSVPSPMIINSQECTKLSHGSPLVSRSTRFSFL